MNFLVTGVAGFIGFSLAKELLARGHSLVGLDNLDSYYDVALKKARLELLLQNASQSQFSFLEVDVCDKNLTQRIKEKICPSKVIHLAAQAGVRYSLENPQVYLRSNLEGFLNILEYCRYENISHLIYASTSSVYGANTAMPFSEHASTEHPLSFYAATKKANELMAHSYSSLFQLPTTGLRFFTVYGPWGRPDMALFLFTKNILAGKPIKIFGHGNHIRDFTYIDDIVDGLVRIAEGPVPSNNPSWNSMHPDPASSFAPYRIYNIGNNQPVELMDTLQILERVLGRKADIQFLPLQPGDVRATRACVDDLVRDYDFKPSTSIHVGIERFVKWYRDYYKV